MLAVSLLIGCGPESEIGSYDSAVIDGQIAEDASFDAVGALVRVTPTDPPTYEAFCTGTLISPNRVLTAHHCIDTKEPSEVFFAIGYDSASPKRVIAVADFDERFTAQPTELGVESMSHGDVAVLELQQSVQDIKPMGMENLTPDDVGKSFVIIGYGYSTSDMTELGVRNWGHSTILELRDEYLVSVGRRNVEARACQGDSGGPLLGTVDGTRTIFGVARSTSITHEWCVNPATYTRFGPRACENGIEVGMAGCDGDTWATCEGGSADGPSSKPFIDCAAMNPPRMCVFDTSGFANCVPTID
ncbi:MAG: trypsin-like serine protease [Deltaproteobacteria bacterium]|nr:trypsin-like serine protease [Deltaproteobacteria bacterium]